MAMREPMQPVVNVYPAPITVTAPEVNVTLPTDRARDRRCRA